ncbi:hypothetical protein CJF31_00008782 [Rutstroemia sp. NJR-2017a BVV2]|nr:hypothetical protein CJF31_00008782 [Rutstroemia sp. NJR-2017a BVV2]
MDATQTSSLSTPSLLNPPTLYPNSFLANSSSQLLDIFLSIHPTISFTLFTNSPKKTNIMSRTPTTLLHTLRTLKPFHLSRSSHRFASTSTGVAAKNPVYFGPVYWGKAWKDVGGTFLLYVPIVAAVMFWPMPVVPLMNRSKGIKKERRVAPAV